MGDMSKIYRHSYADENNKYGFLWKIENVSSGYSKDRKVLKSPVFMPDNLDGSKWYLTLHLPPPAPSHATDNSKGVYTCFLHRSEDDSGSEEMHISCRLQMIGGRNMIATRGVIRQSHIFKRGDHSADVFVRANRRRVTSDSLNWNDDTLYIYCWMFKMLKRNEARTLTRDEAFTKIGIDRISFNWDVNACDCIGGSSQSLEFSMSETSKYSITITVCQDTFKIQIKDVKEDSISSSYMRGEISLLNPDGVKILTQTGEYLFNASDENNVWNFPSFITLNHFFKDEEKYCLPRDTFSLFCEFSVPNGQDRFDVALSEKNPLLLSVTSLRDDYRKLLKNMNNSDVELRTANGILRAHKFILSVRSPVFSAMFNHNMMETKSNVVEIPDADAKTMRYFLEYVYVGATDVRDCESVLKLLLIANKYQVLSLEGCCSSILKSVLSVENAFDILCLADMVDLKPLKECSLDFIVAHITEMWNTTEWKEFVENYEEQSSMIFARLSEHLAFFS